MALNVPQLRNALRKLRALPLGDNPTDHVMAPQEMLDLLACAAGIKPVCILGRGFSPPGWPEGAAAIARSMGLHILRAPFWKCDDGFPEDIAVAIGARKGDDQDAYYVTRSKATLSELEALRDSGSMPSVEQESGLSGYPACCVAEHRQNVRNIGAGFMLMLDRHAGGDQGRLMDLIGQDISLSPETPEEERLMGSIEHMEPASFTSINMCPPCALVPHSPARKLSALYRALAAKLDPELVRQIERSLTDLRGL